MDHKCQACGANGRSYSGPCEHDVLADLSLNSAILAEAVIVGRDHTYLLRMARIVQEQCDIAAAVATRIAETVASS